MAISASVRRWLLHDSDPSVRRRFLTEVLDRPAGDPEVRETVRDQRRVGWAAKILADQLPAGQWASPATNSAGLYLPKYIATNWRLLVLADFGLTRSTPGIARGMRLMLRNNRAERPHDGLGGKDSEVCYTGNALRMLLRFGYRDDPFVATSIDWLVRHQKDDGGWHCFRSRVGTLDGWEALAAFAALPGPLRSPRVQRSIERGADFYLERGLLREGRTAYAPWTRLHYPVHYYYDLLVGLDTLTRLGYGDDPRMRGPLSRLEAKRRDDGRWNLDALHPDLGAGADYGVRTPFYPFALEMPGAPSRWITATALGVLHRAGRV
jgi:hypothetical protein